MRVTLLLWLLLCPAVMTHADPVVPRWRIGMCGPQPLMTARNRPKEPFCKSPGLLLSELVRRINADKSGCYTASEKTEEFGYVLEVRCLLEEDHSCRDWYVARIWGNHPDNAPSRYTIYGLGATRRVCGVRDLEYRDVPGAIKGIGARGDLLLDVLKVCGDTH